MTLRVAAGRRLWFPLHSRTALRASVVFGVAVVVVLGPLNAASFECVATVVNYAGLLAGLARAGCALSLVLAVENLDLFL